jgi:hypothetical protein
MRLGSGTINENDEGLNFILVQSLHLYLDPSSGSLQRTAVTKILYEIISSSRKTCLAHCILLHLFLPILGRKVCEINMLRKIYCPKRQKIYGRTSMK